MERPGVSTVRRRRAPHAWTRRLSRLLRRESLQDALDMLMPIEGKSFLRLEPPDLGAGSFSLHQHSFLSREILSSFPRRRAKAFSKTNGISTIDVIRSAAIVARLISTPKKKLTPRFFDKKFDTWTFCDFAFFSKKSRRQVFVPKEILSKI